MEQSSQPAQQVVGGVAGPSQGQYAGVLPGAPPIFGAIDPSAQDASSFPANLSQLTNQQQLAYQQVQQFHHQQQQHQQQQLQAFWANQMAEIEQTTDFKNHSLPLARIKKIMKADEDVRMISAEAPVVFAKACEVFILELTLRAWIHTEENKRRTLQKNDIAAAISRTDIFDFLVDIIPRDELKEEGLGLPRVPLTGITGPAESIPGYYYMPMQPGMIMGNPVDQATAAAMYPGQQHMAYLSQQPQAQTTPPSQPAQAQNSDSADE